MRNIDQNLKKELKQVNELDTEETEQFGKRVNDLKEKRDSLESVYLELQLPDEPLLEEMQKDISFALESQFLAPIDTNDEVKVIQTNEGEAPPPKEQNLQVSESDMEEAFSAEES